MNLTDMSLSFNEKVMFSLRSLYEKYGYTQYKMSKFEEYDLYAGNKEFLISDSVITFTDTNGKLMALKPDVTLSIIKNTKDLSCGVQKVYYNENVYRATKSTGSFKEIMQSGVECFGKIDSYCICEVLTLAISSLKSISEDCILDVSDLGVISAVIESMGISDSGKSSVLKCISQKNAHELIKVCGEMGVDREKAEMLGRLVTTNGRAEKVLPQVKEMLGQVIDPSVFCNLESLVSAIDCGDNKSIINIDFSVVDDINYYNGIVFKGFINGIPGVVLSGGQYNKLMKKMGRKSGAVGFAVYLDMLGRMNESVREYDVDTVVLYDDSSDLSGLNECVGKLIGQGRSVSAQKDKPLNMKYRQLLKYKDGEVEALENNA